MVTKSQSKKCTWKLKLSFTKNFNPFVLLTHLFSQVLGSDKHAECIEYGSPARVLVKKLELTPRGRFGWIIGWRWWWKRCGLGFWPQWLRWWHADWGGSRSASHDGPYSARGLIHIPSHRAKGAWLDRLNWWHQWTHCKRGPFQDT